MGTKNKPGRFDCYDAAEDDEPMFVLLARDPDAADTVEAWARSRFDRLARLVNNPHNLTGVERKERDCKIADGLQKITEALHCAQAMREWKPKPPEILPLPLTRIPSEPVCRAPFCDCKSAWNCPAERYRALNTPPKESDLQGMGE